MGTYLFEVTYTPEAWAKQLRHPVNRVDAIRPVIEKAGGEIVSAYYAFGETDVILIIRLPGDQAAASLSMAFSSGKALSRCQVTVLMEIEDGIEAIKQGGTLMGVYNPPD